MMNIQVAAKLAELETVVRDLVADRDSLRRVLDTRTKEVYKLQEAVLIAFVNHNRDQHSVSGTAVDEDCTCDEWQKIKDLSPKD